MSVTFLTNEDEKNLVRSINGAKPDPETGDVKVTIPESGGNVDQVSIEPAEDDIPKVFITGVKPTTKDDVLAEMEYISKTDRFHAYLEIKCQGSSSMSFEKKNFTIKLYSDETRETKLKKDFKDWHHPCNKFVLKANWIDHSHARNIVSARIWDEVVKSRSNYAELPEAMRNSPQSGAIDGFPVKLYYNGTYEGLYTWNIGKDAWMWGMDEDNPNHSLLSCSYNDNGVLLNKAGNFRALWSGVHEDNWDIEVGTQGTALTNSLNALISCVKDTDDETFKATIGTYLDINSALDYYLYFWANAGLDSLENNMLLATYDGVKWICGAYDMDSVWGLHYTGGSFIATDFKCPDKYQGPYSLLWERITTLFIPELKVRYTELRSGVLSYPNIVTNFERFMDVIGSDLYAEDLTIYTGIPSGATNNIRQIRNYVRDRLAYVDSEIEAMGQEAVEIPCTGISLSTSELAFDSATSQTLIATMEPVDTTDAVIWTSNAPDVVSVSGGVVTAISNGTAIVTATCGDFSANCAVVVSGIEDVEDGDVLNESQTVQTLNKGYAFDDTTGVMIENANCYYTPGYYPVTAGATYGITFSAVANWVAVYEYNEDLNYIGLKNCGNVGSFGHFIYQPSENTKYVRWLALQNTSDIGLDTTTIIKIGEVLDESENALEMWQPVNIKNGGQIVQTTGYAMPQYYPVIPGVSYRITMGASAQYPGVHEYDESLNYIGENRNAVTSGGTLTFTATANAKYVRWACLGAPENPTTIVVN